MVMSLDNYWMNIVVSWCMDSIRIIAIYQSIVDANISPSHRLSTAVFVILGFYDEWLCSREKKCPAQLEKDINMNAEESKVQRGKELGARSENDEAPVVEPDQHDLPQADKKTKRLDIDSDLNAKMERSESGGSEGDAFAPLSLAQLEKELADVNAEVSKLQREKKVLEYYVLLECLLDGSAELNEEDDEIEALQREKLGARSNESNDNDAAPATLELLRNNVGVFT